MDVRFKRHDAIGPPGAWTHGTLLEFLFALPTVLRPGPNRQPVPPLAVLNDVFRSGARDAGMSGACEWKPFEIDETDYRSLVDELVTMPGYDFVEDLTLESRAAKDWMSESFRKYPPRPGSPY